MNSSNVETYRTPIAIVMVFCDFANRCVRFKVSLLVTVLLAKGHNQHRQWQRPWKPNDTPTVSTMAIFNALDVDPV